MTDTIASLKQELKILGPVDYSTQTRQLREMILNKISILKTGESIESYDARTEAERDERQVANEIKYAEEGRIHAIAWSKPMVGRPTCYCKYCEAFKTEEATV